MTDAPIERRKHPRIRVQFRVTLSLASGRTPGEGKLLNLSQAGCAIQGDRTLKKGDCVSLLIHASAHDRPIEIQSAVVRWVQRGDFGVEFERIQTEEATRLRQLLDTTTPGAGTE